jgi:hypothetical protein
MVDNYNKGGQTDKETQPKASQKRHKGAANGDAVRRKNEVTGAGRVARALLTRLSVLIIYRYEYK